MAPELLARNAEVTALAVDGFGGVEGRAEIAPNAAKMVEDVVRSRGNVHDRTILENFEGSEGAFVVVGEAVARLTSIKVRVTLIECDVGDFIVLER